MEARKKRTKQNRDNNPDMLQAALDYAGKDLKIFPCHSVDKNGNCTCRNPDCPKKQKGKHPRIKNMLNEASNNPEQIEMWWTQWPDANIGCPTGKRNKIMVIDVDGPADEEELSKYSVPDTLQASSGRPEGGRHLYFRYPDRYVKNTTKVVKGKFLDSRGDGGYVILPPSLHKAGSLYSWKEDNGFLRDKIADTPEWWIVALGKKYRSEANKKKTSAEPTDIIRDGERNDTLFLESCWLRDKGWSHKDVLTYIWGRYYRNCETEFENPEYEVPRLVESAFSYIKEPEKDIKSILEASSITSTELITKKIPEPACIISPWLHDESTAEIYSERGQGKTFLSLSIALAVTREKAQEIKIGPWKVKNPTGVLLLDGEMGEYNLQQRIKRLSKPLRPENEGNPLITMSYDSFHDMDFILSNEKIRDGIYDFLEDHKRIQLLIIDNLSAFLPGVDENQKKDWDPYGLWIRRIKKLGLSVIFIHHSGKSGQQRGTSAREDALDCVLYLKPTPGKKQGQCDFIVTFEKSRNVRQELKPFRFQIEPDPTDKTKPSDIWTTSEDLNTGKGDVIMALLIEGWKQNVIASTLDVSKSYASQMNTKAKEKGYINEKGKPTPEGLKFKEKFDLKAYRGR